ncbi:hypothetical protein [Parasphingopyxis sp.]|uniref:hypothetical protein n=1 Tax=Parasphingopyxis sp. TaxID=1920299 RepID=UPI0026100E95|nr:hypothetical protein [Parasphingopyxis sp.]
MKSMSIPRTACLLPIALALAACAHSGANYEPIVDGPVGGKYYADLEDCQALARSPQIDRHVDNNALAGAAVGGVIGAIEDDSVGGALVGAALGALIGGIGGSAEANAVREDVIIDCMLDRGHPVVG